MLRLIVAQVCLTSQPRLDESRSIHSSSRTCWASRSPSASGLLYLYILAGPVGAPATTSLSSRIGKHRALMINTTAYSIGLTAVMVIPKDGTCSPRSR